MSIDGKLQERKLLIIYTFIFAVLFCPTFLLRFLFAKIIYYVTAVIALAVFAVVCYKRRNDISVPAFIMSGLVFLLYSVIMLATIVNSGEIIDYGKQCFMFVTLFSVLLVGSSKGRYPIMLNAGILVLEVYSVINIITIVLFREGLYSVVGYTGYTNEGYLFGHKNNCIEWLLPLMGMIIIKNIILEKKKDLNYYFVMLLSLCTVVLSNAANAIVAVGFFLFFEILFMVKENWKISNLIVFYVAYIIGTILLTVFQVHTYFLELIFKIFHRGHTVNSRTRIWNNSVYWIKNKVILGNGVENIDDKYDKIGHMNSCHNYLLDLWYYGGILTVLTFSIIIVYMAIRLHKNSKYVLMRISTVFGAYFIIGLATPLHRSTMSVMFAMMLLAITIPISDTPMEVENNSYNEEIL